MSLAGLQGNRKLCSVMAFSHEGVQFVVHVLGDLCNMIHSLRLVSTAFPLNALNKAS